MYIWLYSKKSSAFKSPELWFQFLEKYNVDNKFDGFILTKKNHETNKERRLYFPWLFYR